MFILRGAIWGVLWSTSIGKIKRIRKYVQNSTCGVPFHFFFLVLGMIFGYLCIIVNSFWKHHFRSLISSLQTWIILRTYVCLWIHLKSTILIVFRFATLCKILGIFKYVYKLTLKDTISHVFWFATLGKILGTLVSL
jgi:NhaP-type Na+/H+ and K+/H+ antiporter